MLDLILFCGLPGSGKSTLAAMLCHSAHAADDYHPPGPFDPANLPQAHAQCIAAVEADMLRRATPIGVANTFSRDWERDAYRALAQRHGYRIHEIYVSGRHGSKSVHNVPESTIARMRERFEVDL